MFIYKTTNLINGMIYVGKCEKDRPNYFGSGIHLKYAIKKYGKENFVREIIADNINDKELLGELEKYWIGYYDARNPEIGYNIAEGGDFGSIDMRGENSGMFGKHHTEETKKKMSDSKMGEGNPNFRKRLSEETIKKISESCKNVDKHSRMFVRHHTQETKDKMSKIKLGKRLISDDVVSEIKKLLYNKVPIKRIAKILHINVIPIRKIRDNKYNDIDNL